MVCFTFSLSACSKSDTLQDDSGETESGLNFSDGKNLIVYFSVPETSNPNGMNAEEENSTIVVDDVVLGNTQFVANNIQKLVGGDIFRIEPKNPYPTQHSVLVDQAKQEQNTKARPEIKDKIKNLDDYDTIFIGYPNWWSDMPMILYSFFEDYDLSDKIIVPFNTHGGSGLSETIQTISELEPKAKVIKNGFSISRDQIEETEKELTTWLKELK